MNEVIKPLLAGTAVFVFTVLAGFFFQTIGLNLEFFLIPNIEAILKTVFSILFWVFVVSFSLPFAAAAGFSLYGNKLYYSVFCVAGALTGSAVNITIFPAFKEFLLLIPFYVIALGLTAYFSKPPVEMQMFSKIRALNASIKIGLLVMAIGIFAFVFYSVSQNEKTYLNKFEDSFAKSIEGDLEKKIDLDIEQKNQFLVTIMGSPQYLNLALKKDEDTDINAFIALMQAVIHNLNSDEFRQKAITENKKLVNVHLLLSDKIPAYDLITKKFSLFQAVMLFFSFLFARGFVLGPIAIAFAWVFSKIEENTLVTAAF